MSAKRSVSRTGGRDVRPRLALLAGLLGLGFLVLVVVPVSTAVAVVIAGGDGVVALGLLVVAVLGLLLVLAALPVALVGVVWLVGRSARSRLEAYVTDQRRSALDWAETVEADRWWGPLVRPTERLAFLDPRTAAERFEAELEATRRGYVAGELSDVELERRLDRLFGIGADAVGIDGSGAGRSTPPREDPDDRRAPTAVERIVR